MEQVTVDEAIKKGHRMITYPVLLVMLGLLGGTVFIGVQHKSETWIWAAGISASIILAWLVWSIKVTKWKVWAFEHVRNVHELKRRAVQENLIWDDSSSFNKTEIWAAADKEKWDLLQVKFSRKDEFVAEEDQAVPFETVVYYSKGANIVEMLGMLVCMGVGIYMLVKKDSYLFGSVLALAGVYFAYKELKQATNTAAQIIINETGLQTISTPFYEWKDIEDEDVETQGSGKYTHHYLTYLHAGGRERLLVDDYQLTPKQLKKLLKVYRTRSMKKR